MKPFAMVWISTFPIKARHVAARSRMTRYIVLGKEPIVIERNVSRRSATRKYRNRLAAVTLAKEVDLGKDDTQFEERSHVGYLVTAGDVCLGYDLRDTQLVDDEAEQVRAKHKLPDVIVVRKLYGGVATQDVNAAKMRIWKLERLDMEVAESMRARTAKKDAEMDDMDEEDFMREVEADKEMRKNMNLYKSQVLKKKAQDENDAAMKEAEAQQNNDDDEEEDDQEVKLDELLDGLVLDEGPDEKDAKEKKLTMTDEEAWEMAATSITEGEKASKDGINYVGRDASRQVRDKETAVPVSGNAFAKDYMDVKFK